MAKKHSALSLTLLIAACGFTNPEATEKNSSYADNTRPEASEIQPQELSEGVLVVDNIPENTTFTHSGQVIVNNNVGDGANIDIKNGGLLVKGNIGDGVTVTVTGEKVSVSSDDNSVSVSGNNSVVINNSSVGDITISGGDDSVVIIDGKSVSVDGQVAELGLSGIQVEGNIGDDARLTSTSKIDIRDAGRNLFVYAGNSFNANKIGSFSDVVAGNSIRIDVIGSHSKLEAGNSIESNEIRTCVIVKAGNLISAETVDQSVFMDAGNNIRVTEYLQTNEAPCP